MESKSISRSKPVSKLESKSTQHKNWNRNWYRDQKPISKSELELQKSRKGIGLGIKDENSFEVEVSFHS